MTPVLMGSSATTDLSSTKHSPFSTYHPAILVSSIMPEHDNSLSNNRPVESSPLSSPPSICLSFPSPEPSIANRPRPFSASEPESKENGAFVVRRDRDLIHGTTGDLPYGREGIKGSARSLRAMHHPSFGPVEPAFAQQKPSVLSRGSREQNRFESVLKDDPSPISLSSARRPLLAFFSSASSNLNPWPSSPLADKVNKSGYPTATLRKRKAALDDENDRLTSAAVSKAKKSGIKAPLLDCYGNQYTSPDYKMMLNLSYTPSSNESDYDPFTQSHHLDLMRPKYHLSTSRDPSPSPTIKNPSLNSLNSEEISAVCLAPAADKRSPSYGLFACSGYLDDDGNSKATGTSKAENIGEIEKRRIAEVIQRWAKSGISVNDATSFELYKSPDDLRRPGPMIALAPPRPVDRLLLEQHSRALDARGRWPGPGVEASNGLLDVVCEAEAAVLQGSIDMGWSFSSLAPADMHLRPKLTAIPPPHLQRDKEAGEALALEPRSTGQNDSRSSFKKEDVDIRHNAQDPKVRDFAAPPARTTIGGSRKSAGPSLGRRRLKLTQSGATLALIVKESARRCLGKIMLYVSSR